MKLQADIFVYFIKLFIIGNYVYFSFRRILNINEKSFKKIIIILVSNLLLSIVGTYIEFYINTFFNLIIICCLYGIVLGKVTHNKIAYSIIIALISYAICEICSLISVILVYLLYQLIYLHSSLKTLIINDYFKGQIAKIKVDGISHYFNIIDNKIIDLTKTQFKSEIDYKDYKIVHRNDILTEDTKNRYQRLKKKVIKELLQKIDKEVYQCTLCQNLVEKFPNSNTVFLGNNNDIVLIGEAPANNGWRKSHMLWKDSGVILQKLFDIINKDIFETTFLESVKCFPVERKNLKTCSKNCKQIMEKQLEILQPKLIITLGEFPTRNLLDFKFKKFQEVVGNIYEVNGYQILPIYHPSPISPKSYKGNIPIFEKLYNMNYNKNEN